jgi:polysaccharide deacetylase family protein (PEP-CTERM system associated)
LIVATPTHVFSVDLEEYFQVSAFDECIERAAWSDRESRVEASTERLLELLGEFDVHATFFTLGWIAERHPGLVRRVAEAGHEIASHGWWHRRIPACTPGEFRREVVDSRRILEDVTGVTVLGHRAPSFSLVPGSEWAFDLLIEAGYAYDSSIFPVHRGDYGYPGWDPEPHYVQRSGGRIFEIPLTTTTVGGWRVPAAGGGYLRHLPYGLTRRAFREHTESGRPGMFYVHPWELDPEQPRLDVPLLARLRHYGGLDRTMPRLRRLLSEFEFGPVRDVYPELGAAGGSRAQAAPVHA